MPASDARNLALVIALLGAGSAHGANLLTNGSFDDVSIGTGAYTYTPGANAPGWTFHNSALVNAQGGSAWYGGSAPAGTSGIQFAALQSQGSISQTFTASAQTLHLGWLDAGRPAYGCCNGDQSYSVLLNGASVGPAFSTASGSSFKFNSLSLSNLTPGASYNLAFQGLIGSDQTAFIDAVVLSASQVPAPAMSPTKTIYQTDLPLPPGQSLIDDFDSQIAPGYAFSGGFVRSGADGLAPGVSAPPPGDLTNYLTVLGGQQAVLTAVKPLKSFSFYMGSPDSYNSIRFIGPAYDFTLSGDAIWLPAAGGGGDQSWGRRISYDFGGYGVNRIIFASGSNSFEFDRLAGSAAVPEPATWAMMIFGFATAGAWLRRRRSARA